MVDDTEAAAPGPSEEQINLARFANAVHCHQFGKFDEAQALCQAILDTDPHHTEAYQLLGVLKAKQRQPAEALACFDQVLALAPNNAAALANRAAVLSTLARFAEALEAYDRLLEQKPTLSDAVRGRGNALYQLGRFDEAFDAYTQALALKPNDVSTLHQHGTCLLSLKRPAEALASYDRALELAPNHLPTLINRGSTLREQKQLERALASYDRALTLAPRHAGALYNRAQLLLELGRPEEAEECYAGLVALDPLHGEGHYGRANALVALGRLADALQSYAAALAVMPNRDFLYGSWLHTKMRLCDWNDLALAFASLAERLAEGIAATSPFPVLATPLGGALQRKAAETFVRTQHPVLGTDRRRTLPREGSRIRIGYFSADFRNHAVSYLTRGLYEHHDRTRFELHAFSLGLAARDEMRERLEPLFDEFRDVRTMSDAEVANLSNALGIDVAIDLGGYTTQSRSGIFALRAAPIQVNYLGYPGTSGADYIDYLIGDAVLIPKGQRAHYSEKIVYLPHTFQANDSYRPLREAPSRPELGLPQSTVVLASFNNSYKLNPMVFDRWLALLKRVPGAVLWLIEDNPWQRQNLSAWASTRGISPERLIYAPKLSYADHLVRLQSADLVLDCWPFGGGTSSSDALRAGVPVVTLLGDTFAGRMTASLLGAVGLAELVTGSPGEYEELAVTLALQPARRAELRQKLARNRTTFPLFDSRRFTQYLEAAYSCMVDRYTARLPADHIYISA